MLAIHVIINVQQIRPPIVSAVLRVRFDCCSPKRSIAESLKDSGVEKYDVRI